VASRTSRTVSVPPETHVTYSRQYRRCGRPNCATCRDGRGHGPYWYAVWREEGRLRHRYLGATLPSGIALEASSAAQQPLRVRTLGAFAVWRGDVELPAEGWRRRKAAALFTALLSSPSQIAAREQVCEWLWPETDPAAATRNLHGAVRQVRLLLGDAESVRLQGEMVRLVAPVTDPDWLDAAAFERAARAAMAGREVEACRAALARYRGEYLPDQPYADWVLGRRESLRSLHLALLLHAADLCGAIGEGGQAEEHLRAILAIDPCSEEAAARLMVVLAGAGRPAEALAVYKDLAVTLARELDMMPSPDLKELQARILAHQEAPTAALVLPRREAKARSTNLPVALTSLIGREDERRQVRGLLARSRLLTLTGAGGAGKTRMALATAGELIDGYADGIWLVELAAIGAGDDTGPVQRAVAAALGLREEPGRTIAETLSDFLAPRTLLLVLDNCEHLVEASAAVSAMLLSVCPGLRILATSREPLGVSGETVYGVPSLAVPPATADAEDLYRYSASALFIDRAQAQQPGFAVTATNATAIAQICAALEGIPLAIELAAARAGTLGVESMAARIDERLRLLTGGPRTALPRQRTLRATLDWSYNLLSGAERTVLGRLSVFAGGCSLEAAEAVCAGGSIAAEDVLDLLERLVRHSLVLSDPAGGVLRYHQLEMVREYGREHAAASGERDRLGRQHLHWCLALAEQGWTQDRSAGYPSWLQRLELDHDNIRAALAWAMAEGGDPEAGIRLMGALCDFWHRRGHLNEGRRWLDHALRLLETGALKVPLKGRARVLYGAALLANYQGASAPAVAMQSEVLAIAQELGDPIEIARAMHNLGVMLFGHGEYDRAASLLGENLQFERERNNRRSIALSLLNLGMATFAQGDLPQARVLHEEGLAIAQELGDLQILATELSNLALLAFVQGDHVEAMERFGRSAALYWELHDPRILADALNGAAVAGVQADPERATLLFGAVQALRETIGVPLAPVYHDLHANAVAAARAALGDTFFAEQLARGRALPLEAAVQCALRVPRESASG
jgi:predicted ATPase/DNA-binding SARP family transcriptional activator